VMVEGCHLCQCPAESKRRQLLLMSRCRRFVCHSRSVPPQGAPSCNSAVMCAHHTSTKMRVCLFQGGAHTSAKCCCHSAPARLYRAAPRMNPLVSDAPRLWTVQLPDDRQQPRRLQSAVVAWAVDHQEPSIACRQAQPWQCCTCSEMAPALAHLSTNWPMTDPNSSRTMLSSRPKIETSSSESGKSLISISACKHSSSSSSSSLLVPHGLTRCLQFEASTPTVPS